MCVIGIFIYSADMLWHYNPKICKAGSCPTTVEYTHVFGTTSTTCSGISGSKIHGAVYKMIRMSKRYCQLASLQGHQSDCKWLSIWGRGQIGTVLYARFWIYLIFVMGIVEFRLTKTGIGLFDRKKTHARKDMHAFLPGQMKQILIQRTTLVA